MSVASPPLILPLDSSLQCSSPYPHSSLLSTRIYATPDVNRRAVRNSFFPVSGITSMDSTTKSHRNCAASWKLRRWRAQAYAGEDNMAESGDTEDGSTQATVEQGKRVLALQKDLLEQIAERKKLVMALRENLGSAAEQVKAYSSKDVKQDDSSLPQEKPFQQDFIGERRPMVNNVTTSDTQMSTHDQVSKFNASVVQESETVSTPEAHVRNISFPSPTQTPGSPSLAQQVFIPVEEYKITEEKQVPLLEKLSEEPESTSTTDEVPPPLAGPNVTNVVIVASECAPWSKTGGLGDVAGALPKALARRGHRVMVVAPRYGVYKEAFETGVRKRYNVAGQDLEVGYFHAYIDGVDYVFVDNSVFHGFANNIYGGNREDILKRMVLLCKAAVEAPWHIPCGGVCYGDGNLVFIANDWHTALLPVYLQAYYRDNGLMQFARSILVIHNMAHQGRGPLSDYSLLGLPDHYIDKFRLYDPIGGEHFNVFMGGLITAHRIVTVSHGYAWECQTQLGGWGLDGVVRDHNWKLRGIVNGIDDKEWSPELDVYLKSDGYTNYSLETLEAGKGACKAALQKELGLPVRADVPLLGFIGRLDQQKGVDIIADAMPWMMQQDLQLVMLGTGRPDLENMLRSFEGQHRDKVRGWVGFSVKTAHRITAGCDILLMPSRFEPCGLNQLYAMQYGTVPVVHAVGGLKDTVEPFDPYSNKGTGWTFDKADAGGMIHALGNAMWTFHDYKESWRDIQKRSMSQDLSWDNAAKQYEEVIVAAKYQW